MSENIFDLETQWKLYLKHGEVREEDMPAVQVQETRRAFFGAIGQLILLLRDDISALPDKEGIEVMENMMQQVAKFWNTELEKDRQKVRNN